MAISPKVFETLLILVRHSRQVVSKEDFMKALWPDAFVEEANLSQNIFMLRKALGDTPEDRRYIVTLPGRGYRFAEQVRTVTQDGEDVVIESRSRAQMVVEQAGSAPSETLHVLPTSLNRKLSWKYLLPIGSVVALLVVLVLLVRGPAFFLHRRQAMVLGEKDSVLVADFTNTTGDPVFDGTLRQGLAVQLEQSPFLSLVSEDRIQRALRLMGQPSDARLTPEIARQICERTASAAFLQGSIANMGSQYVLGVRATHCRTGEVVAEEQAQAARKEDVLNAGISSDTRTRLSPLNQSDHEPIHPIGKATSAERIPAMQ